MRLQVSEIISFLARGSAPICFHLQDRQWLLKPHSAPALGMPPADLHGSSGNRPDGKNSSQLVGSNGSQTHRSVASARGTIRRAPKLAGRNFSFQIGPNCLRLLGEYAL